MAITNCDFITYYTGKTGFRYLSKIMYLATSTKTVVVLHNFLSNSKDHSLNTYFAKRTWSGAADLLPKLMTPLLIDMGTSSKSKAFSQPTEENRLNIICLEGINAKHLAAQNKYTFPERNLYLIPVAIYPYI